MTKKNKKAEESCIKRGYHDWLDESRIEGGGFTHISYNPAERCRDCGKPFPELSALKMHGQPVGWIIGPHNRTQVCIGSTSYKIL